MKIDLAKLMSETDGSEICGEPTSPNQELCLLCNQARTLERELDELTGLILVSGKIAALQAAVFALRVVWPCTGSTDVK